MKLFTLLGLLSITHSINEFYNYVWLLLFDYGVYKMVLDQLEDLVIFF